LTAFADRVGDALVGTFALTRRELGELIGVLYQQVNDVSLVLGDYLRRRGLGRRMRPSSHSRAVGM
jgi:hypothetical protein